MSPWYKSFCFYKPIISLKFFLYIFIQPQAVSDAVILKWSIAGFNSVCFFLQ